MLIVLKNSGIFYNHQPQRQCGCYSRSLIDSRFQSFGLLCFLTLCVYRGNGKTRKEVTLPRCPKSQVPGYVSAGIYEAGGNWVQGGGAGCHQGREFQTACSCSTTPQAVLDSVFCFAFFESSFFLLPQKSIARLEHGDCLQS